MKHKIKGENFGIQLLFVIHSSMMRDDTQYNSYCIVSGINYKDSYCHSASLSINDTLKIPTNFLFKKTKIEIAWLVEQRI